MSNVNIIFGDYEPSKPEKEKEPESPRKWKEYYYFVSIEDYTYRNKQYACHVVHYVEYNTYGLLLDGLQPEEKERTKISKLTSVYLDGNGIPIGAKFIKTETKQELTYTSSILDSLLDTSHRYIDQSKVVLKNSKAKETSITENILENRVYIGTAGVKFEIWDEFFQIIQEMGNFVRTNTMNFPYSVTVEESKKSKKLRHAAKTIASLTPPGRIIVLGDNLLKMINDVFDLNIPLYDENINYYGPIQLTAYNFKCFIGDDFEDMTGNTIFSYIETDENYNILKK